MHSMIIFIMIKSPQERHQTNQIKNMQRFSNNNFFFFFFIQKKKLSKKNRLRILKFFLLWPFKWSLKKRIEGGGEITTNYDSRHERGRRKNQICVGSFKTPSESSISALSLLWCECEEGLAISSFFPLASRQSKWMNNRQ